MASVSSLDKDLRNLRLGKYTPQAANEARKWIEETLGEPIAPGDLLDALKDGTVLCKYVLSSFSKRHENKTYVLYVQTRQSCNWTTRCPLQAVFHAVCPDGKYFSLSSCLPIIASESPIS